MHESNSDQQIALFIYISLNGQYAVGNPRARRGRRGEEGAAEDDGTKPAELPHELAVRGVVLLRRPNCQARYQESDQAHDKTLSLTSQ